jgi:hypothetical protein
MQKTNYKTLIQQRINEKKQPAKPTDEEIAASLEILKSSLGRLGKLDTTKKA